MEALNKDILLIGDTFVFDLHEYKEKETETEDEGNLEDQVKQKVGFEDTFVKALREDFAQSVLADRIVDLLNESTNPAVLHLSSALDKEGFSYDSVNCSLKHRKQLIHYLKNRKYRMIGISTTFTQQEEYIIDLVDFIKKYAPKSKIIIGGMFIVKLFKLKKEEVVREGLPLLNADYLIFNEIGEQTLIDILKFELYSKPDIRNIMNIAYKTENGIQVNPYQVMDIDTSVSNWMLSPNTTYAFLRASISCLFKCKFCDFPIIADKYKSKSVEILRQEFESIKKAGIKYVRFLDDTFNLPKQHFNTILKELTSRDYGFEWVAYIRCQYLDDETVRLMKESGCIGVFLGIESGNNTILKNMNKCATVEEYLKGISILHKYNIPSYAAFIVGFPGETDETIEDTIRFIKQAKFQYYRLFTWAYADLSPIANEKEKYGIKVCEDSITFSMEWKHATMNSREALEKSKYIMKQIDSSIHCTVPYDYAFYLNRNKETRDIFNDCLRHFNQSHLVEF